MNDQELSLLLQEWPATSAPATLEERVFGPRPLPVPWWGRIPAGALAGIGTAVGALLMSVLFMLVQSEPVVPPPALPAKPIVAPELPAPIAQPAPKKRAVAKAPPPARSQPPVASDPIFVAPAALVYGPMPPYPVGADNSVAELGSVKLRVQIAKDGRITGAEVLEGDPQLAAIALEAVKEWRYRPRLVNGEATESINDVTVYFGRRSRPTKGKAR